MALTWLLTVGLFCSGAVALSPGARHLAKGARLLHQPSDERQKCDEMFDLFDKDEDKALNLHEMQALVAATGGEFEESSYTAACGALGANPSKGLSSEQLFKLYVNFGAGDIEKDHAVVTKISNSTKTS
eukprot:gnl/MRDRNA2_/MRDRNA2_35466_c0_seq1.p1 gnl/MRDRNA2_/MRDRNA2_35466_c0~~gnl/MRDRNA2_/MRDRNA2_35466_c0_seq1.p1  ORF type:complete len:129 (+),score=24.01 gnl/MRDRNA2_/MRDRNA2_35466_c0_seq1:116-502(+)